MSSHTLVSNTFGIKTEAATRLREPFNSRAHSNLIEIPNHSWAIERDLSFRFTRGVI